MMHADEARLNEYVDGRLAPPDVAALEAHLKTCGVCRARVAALRGVVARLAALPRGIRPTRDLRPPIPDRLRGQDAASRAGDRIVPGPAHVRGPEGARPVPAPGRPWLRAAAVVALLSGAGAGVWFGLVPGNGPASTGVAATHAVIGTYARAAGELTATVRDRQAELGPAAVRALEASLAAVDEAIRELEQARATVGRSDPDALDRHLEARYRTKLELLRGALELLEES